jgi:protease-4
LPPAAARPDAAPLRVILEQPTAGWRRWGRRALWLALGFSILANLGMLGAYRSYFQPEAPVLERFHSGNAESLDKIAVLSIEGLILGGENSFTRRQIDQILADPHVKAVVLRVDSPGGTVWGSDYLYHHLTRLSQERKLPVVVSMGMMATSGGYYVSLAAGSGPGRIFAEPTTWTGSIGVIIPHYDLSGLLEKLNVKDDSISSHPLKQMLSSTRSPPADVRAEEEEIVRSLVNDGFARFKELVLAGREGLRKNLASQEVVFTGRILTASEARQHGLVDEIGFLEDAIGRAAELAGLEPGSARVVHYSRPAGLLSLFLDSQSARPGMDLQSLFDISVPRAYYLCTWLPGMGSGPAR